MNLKINNMIIHNTTEQTPNGKENLYNITLASKSNIFTGPVLSSNVAMITFPILNESQGMTKNIKVHLN